MDYNKFSDHSIMPSLSSFISELNLELNNVVEKITNCYVYDFCSYISEYGLRNFFDETKSRMAFLPFSIFGLNKTAYLIVRCSRALSFGIKKCLVVDLDDTLWGGMVGDSGWENLRLGGHDPIGEAYVDFQKTLKSFTNRGVLLGIVSKNEESVALEAINNNPEMVLKLDNFSGWRINWDDKANNIIELIEELNLGPQSVVFIDNDPAERARVGEALPEVFVPEWPEDKMLYSQALSSLKCFDTPIVTDEDRVRIQMYRDENKRERIKRSVSSPEEWLKTLEVKVRVEDMDETNIKRVIQLLNKTNQMNLSTRRMTETEFRDWAIDDNRRIWAFRVSDRFGDYGLTGIASMENDRETGNIIDFILSCRVMGRMIEEVMLSVMITHARRIGLSRIEAKYLPTVKNKPCHDFWKRSGFSFDVTNEIFMWKMETEYHKPNFIGIEN